MQYHSEYRQPGTPSKDRTPWHIQERSGDDRVVPIYRFFAKLRMQLIPYLAREASWCVGSGEPLLRPLLLDDGDDPVTWRIVDQFRLGRDLLVAPVVEEGATVPHALPAGGPVAGLLDRRPRRWRPVAYRPRPARPHSRLPPGRAPTSA